MDEDHSCIYSDSNQDHAPHIITILLTTETQLNLPTSIVCLDLKKAFELVSATGELAKNICTRQVTSMDLLTLYGRRQARVKLTRTY